jgi:hypothetical protein
MLSLILNFNDAVPKLAREKLQIHSRRIALGGQAFVAYQAQYERQSPRRFKPSIVKIGLPGPWIGIRPELIPHVSQTLGLRNCSTACHFTEML